jgi:hypothetical protein
VNTRQLPIILIAGCLALALGPAPANAQPQPLAISQVASVAEPAAGQPFSVAIAVLWDEPGPAHTVTLESVFDAGLGMRSVPDQRCRGNGSTVQCTVTVSQTAPASLIVQAQVVADAAPGSRQRITTTARDEDDPAISATITSTIVVANTAAPTSTAAIVPPPAQTPNPTPLDPGSSPAPLPKPVVPAAPAPRRSPGASNPTITPTLVTPPTAAPPGAGVAETPVVPETIDNYENNYNLETAQRLAWETPYDLSLACPERGACRDGDHDFFLTPVKAGVPFVAATYELGPGVDTTLTVYRPAAGFTEPSTGLDGWRALQGNDDIAPGRTLRSQVLITPDWTGEALLIVAASDRHDPPALPPDAGPAGQYRLIVGSPALPEVQHVLYNQQDTATEPTEQAQAPSDQTASGPKSANPAPSPLPDPRSVTPGPAAADAEEIIREQCTTGTAVVRQDAAPFYAAAAPSAPRRLLATYPRDAHVTLLGSCYLGWVKVQPDDSVTPGWMYAPDLRLKATTDSASPTPDTTPAGDQPYDQSSPAPPTPLQVVALPPVPAPIPTPARREALAVMVRLSDSRKQPVAGVRVQLVSALGETLADAVSPASGPVTFAVDLPPDTAVTVSLPAFGVSAPVDRADPSIAFVLPLEAAP